MVQQLITYHDKNLLEAERTSLREFKYLHRKKSILDQEREQERYEVAFLNNLAQGRKKKGDSTVSAFPRFTDLYNAKEARAKARYWEIDTKLKKGINRDGNDPAEYNRILNEKLRNIGKK